MNVVNFSDGIDGLAAGVCAIAAASFAVIAFDLGTATQRRRSLAAIIAGAALGFLVHNFHPASVFMGDAGSNLLGLLLGCVAVEGTVKTQARSRACSCPLLVLAVPFLDTTFVVLKRLKYRRPVYRADANHFHHRFSRIGFSQRRTVLYLYAWTLMLGGVAWRCASCPTPTTTATSTRWTLVMGALAARRRCSPASTSSTCSRSSSSAASHAAPAPPARAHGGRDRRRRRARLETGEWEARRALIRLMCAPGYPGVDARDRFAPVPLGRARDRRCGRAVRRQRRRGVGRRRDRHRRPEAGDVLRPRFTALEIRYARHAVAWDALTSAGRPRSSTAGWPPPRRPASIR